MVEISQLRAGLACKNAFAIDGKLIEIEKLEMLPGMFASPRRAQERLLAHKARGASMGRRQKIAG